MRKQTKNEYCIIRIYKSSLIQIKEDQKDFQEKIGGGKWSIADTIRERNKILYQLKKDSDEKYKKWKEKNKKTELQ